ncbi:hypothetical protein TWF173_001936 [Orbilia oligospora]|uniref:Cytochrome P450-dit2 n=2 Tax=Orbilia oligospora TaxID=2813651 RepID=G1XSE0_ARTOA|nr:hypothetical protein AOL_s00210g299 [Orbilia oligospora ATCC 24927]EGX43852.1 hypothetical protein AOL_s00210g299 [Orbilia oligospora ATCC 24927]KAF3279105.1 hypothetical protein TWF970_004214 [Orbilia oligospora]KAF3316654.1 hypothetical protein TWF173_001936 [Orbilia oligospora]
MAIIEILLTSLAGSYVLVHLSYLSAVAKSPIAQYAIGFPGLAILQGLVYTIYHWLIYPHFVSPLRKIPGPKEPSFWNGHGKQIVATQTGEPHKLWIKAMPKEGLIYYKGLLNRERVLPTTPKVLAEVLNSQSYIFVKPQFFRFSLRLLGNGILMAEGDEHKRQRKILTPAFHPRHLRSLFPLFWSKTQEMVDLITAEIQSSDAPDPIINFNSWGSRCTLDIIGKAGAGIDFNAMKDPDNDLFKIYQKVFTPTTGQLWMAILNLIMPLWFMQNLPVKGVREVSQAKDFIMKVCLDMIKTKRAQMAEKKPMHPDILSIMIEEGSLSDEEMQNQLMTFMAAGHETTAAAVSWSVWELSRRPEVAERLRNEIRAAIPVFDSDSVTMEQIESIRYLRNFTNEILRFHPPVPVTIREAERDTTLNGAFIPKGTTVMLMPAVINHSEELWGPDAAEFIPERWDKPGGNGGAASNYANLTFLMGPRSCIGQKFSVEEFKAIIVGLAGRFAFEEKTKDMELNVRGGITQRPTHEGILPLRTRVVPGW